MNEMHIHIQHFWVCPKCGTINLITNGTCQYEGCNGQLQLKYIKPTLADAVKFLADGGVERVNQYYELTTPTIEEYDEIEPWTELYSCHDEETIRSTVLQYMEGQIPDDFDALVSSVVEQFEDMVRTRNKLFPAAIDAAYNKLFYMAAHEAGPGDTAGDLTPQVFTPLDIAASLARLAGVAEY